MPIIISYNHVNEEQCRGEAVLQERPGHGQSLKGKALWGTVCEAMASEPEGENDSGLVGN